MSPRLTRANSSASSGGASSAEEQQQVIVGGPAPSVMKGHGAQNSRNYHFPQDLPKFVGGDKAWHKFDSEFVYIVLDLTNVDLSLESKPDITARTNRYIFQCLSRCLDSDYYDIICRHKDQDFKAYKFLDGVVAGTISSR